MALAGVNQFRIALAGRGRWPHAEQAVLGVIDQFASLRHVLGDKFGNADAEIHIRAVGNVLREALGHFIARPADG
jgi:hypothetical protein